MGSGKTWTKEEVKYLEDNWDKLSIPTIADNLGRTLWSIKNKAYSLELGCHLNACEDITINQLFNVIFGRNIDGYRISEWIRNGIPIKKKRSISMNYKVINIDSFWKWAKKNQGLLDFKKFEENSLGAEPNWVKIKRKNDLKISREFKTIPWSQNEDKKLQKYLNEYRYSYKELSKMLKRTEGAIQRRICDLKLKARPIKAANHIKWTVEEYELLAELIKQRVPYNLIADQINKSAKAIRGRVYDMYLTENIDKVATLIGKGTWGDGRPSRPITHIRNNTEEKKQIKQDMVQFVGILKGLIKTQYDDNDYWQKDLCMNWSDYGCNKAELSCDECTSFIRIQPQYCRRCGATVINRKEVTICKRCKVSKKNNISISL